MERRFPFPTRLLILAALTIPACGGRQDGFRFDVHPAGGTVLRGGKPLGAAVVRFHPVDPEAVKLPAGEDGYPLMLTAETDKDGHFSLSSYVADDGVPAGDYVVTVVPIAQVGAEDQTGEESSENLTDDARRSPRRPRDKALARYADPKASPLKATVRPGEPNRSTFELD